MSRCSFPTFSFGLPSLSFSLNLPSLPVVTLAFPFPPFCPLD